MPLCKRRQGICDRAGSSRRGNSALVIVKEFNLWWDIDCYICVHDENGTLTAPKEKGTAVWIGTIACIASSIGAFQASS